MHTSRLQAGDSVMVQAFRADGICYRWWQTTIEQIDTNQITTLAPEGTRVEGVGGGWTQRHHIRAFYWLDRPYNLLEVYRADGSLEELYIHIASPARLQEATLQYIDHELDVVMRPGEAPYVVDQEEFAHAAGLYHYSLEFQAACRTAVVEALELAAHWQIRGLPPASYV